MYSAEPGKILANEIFDNTRNINAVVKDMTCFIPFNFLRTDTSVQKQYQNEV